MSNSIAQSSFVVVTRSISELLAMPVTLNGEQSPLNEKSIAKLEDSLLDNDLQQPIEITLFNNIEVLTGGRHRTASLANLYRDALDSTVVCLQFTAKSAEEVALRVKTSNGSRSMKAGEVKLLDTATKLGFGVLTTESLVASIDTVSILIPGTNTVNMADTKAERIDLFTTALAIELELVYDLGDTTALVLARAIMTPLKKVKATMVHEAKFDLDGTQLTKQTTEKYLMVNEVLSMGTDAVTELLDAVVNSVGNISTLSVTLSAKVYLDAYSLDMGIVQDVQPTVVDGVVTYVTTIKRPPALQRNAARYVKAAIKPIIAEVSEALSIELT
jgi:hypothetical protein